MQHDDSKQPAPTPESAATGAAGVSASRRALLRAGTAAVPVVLTLASGPVSATSNCLLASSFVSAAVYKSRNPGATVIKCSTMSVLDCVNEAQTLRSGNSLYWSKAYLEAPVSAHFTSGTTNLPNQRVGELFFPGAAANGATGVLQRLVAIRVGGGGGFTTDYTAKVWNHYRLGTLGSLLNTAVIPGGTPGGGWDELRLLKWLDYLLNPLSL